MALAECLTILGCQELCISSILTSYRRQRGELGAEMSTALASLRIDCSDNDASRRAKQDRYDEVCRRLDRVWAAALHLESYLHLTSPGQLASAPGISVLQPNPTDPKESILLYLIDQAQQQRLVWSEDSVYQLVPRVAPDAWHQPWQPHASGSLEQWVWRCCDKETHWQYWSWLVHKGTKSLVRMLQHQPQFPRLWQRPDAFSIGDRVLLCTEQRWELGIAEQLVPELVLDFDGDKLFWAALLGWPARGQARFSVHSDKSLGPCETWKRRGLPVLYPALPAAECYLPERFQEAVWASFELDDCVGPLDSWLMGGRKK